MMSVETFPPAYLDVSPSERGGSLGIDFETYRALARTAMHVTEDIPSIMAIYTLPEGCVALDIFSHNQYLCLKIDSENNCLLLFSCNLDAVDVPCILETNLSPSGWRKLAQLARTEIRS